MTKTYLYLAIFANSIGFVVILCLILILTGITTPFISGFAVDASDRIYIGTQNEIRVYEDSMLINTINPQTSRAYVFTINEEGNILLSTPTIIYILDLDGNILDVQEDSGADMYNQLQYKRKFISHNGDEFALVDVIGWTRIIKNGTETVYQISWLSFAVKILIAVCAVALFIFPIWLVKHKGAKPLKK